MSGNSNRNVDRNDNIPVVLRPKVKVEISLDMLDHPGEADADEVERIEDIVRGEEDLGGEAYQGVLDLHDDIKEDVERAEECI